MYIISVMECMVFDYEVGAVIWGVFSSLKQETISDSVLILVSFTSIKVTFQLDCFTFLICAMTAKCF